MYKIVSLAIAGLLLIGLIVVLSYYNSRSRAPSVYASDQVIVNDPNVTIILLADGNKITKFKAADGCYSTSEPICTDKWGNFRNCGPYK